MYRSFSDSPSPNIIGTAYLLIELHIQDCCLYTDFTAALREPHGKRTEPLAPSDRASLVKREVLKTLSTDQVT